MKEEFLHYVWKNMLFHTQDLKDNEGNTIEVIHPGEHNRDSGPDFFNARLKIGGTEWAGNVEIHTKASHFEVHGHHRDHAYDNIILHVVHEMDKEVRNARGKLVPTARIEIEAAVADRYNALINNPYIIACQDDLATTDRLWLRHWLHSLLIERLSEKAESILLIYRNTGNDWEETLYRIICRYFGFRVNAEPFEMLASALPFRIIRRHSDNRFQVEALLFGTSGMLEEGLFREAIHDSYYLKLMKEYRILSHKYSIRQVHGWLWKFSRLRPVNFPTVRISQLAGMLTSPGGLFSKITETRSTCELRSYFRVAADEYWDDHYVFGRKSRARKKKTGDTAVDILLINAVIPVLFSYGILRSDSIMVERALDFLETIDPEENVLMKEWSIAGVEARSAFDSQALIQLRNVYCRKKRCLECRIGSRLISAGGTLKSQSQLLV